MKIFLQVTDYFLYATVRFKQYSFLTLACKVSSSLIYWSFCGPIFFWFSYNCDSMACKVTKAMNMCCRYHWQMMLLYIYMFLYLCKCKLKTTAVKHWIKLWGKQRKIRFIVHQSNYTHLTRSIGGSSEPQEYTLRKKVVQSTFFGASGCLQIEDPI